MSSPAVNQLMLTALTAAAVTTVCGFAAFFLFRWQGELPVWGRVLVWIAIVLLALVSFAGLACTGCATFFMIGG